MNPETGIKTEADPSRIGRIDVGLLLKHLEKLILKGENPARVRAILQKEVLWQQLGAQEQLRRAELAQMAAETQTALKVLARLNHEQPDFQPAWERHLDLLSMLGPAEAFAALLARARPHIDEKGYDRRLEEARPENPLEDHDLLAAAVPFTQKFHRQAALNRFLALFAGRRECFARQWSDRKANKQGYVPERRPMTAADLEEHLSGRRTYGLYLMQSDGRIRTAVIDADLAKSLRRRDLDGPTRGRIRAEAKHLVRRVKELSQAVGACALVEFSGSKGYHFWYFFKEPTACAPVRAALKGLAEEIRPDLTAFSLEVFPKQDHFSGKGFGNLVKLPLGLHRLTGKRAYFPECADRSISAQLDFLLSVDYSDPEKMAASRQAGSCARIVPHPRLKQWVDDYPDLFRLQSCCAPLAQAMALCIEGGHLRLREEKILYQTIGFLPDGRRLLHYLMAKAPEYNPHLVDYRLSRLRGTPIGCRRIHSLLARTGPVCRFTRPAAYPHPLLHLETWREPAAAATRKVKDLNSALEQLRIVMGQVEHFLK